MRFQKRCLLMAVLLFSPAFVFANVSSEQIEKALEIAILKARAAARPVSVEQEDTTVMVAQMEDIPGLLNRILLRLHKAGYDNMDVRDVVDGLWNYFGKTRGWICVKPNKESGRPCRELSNRQLRQQHALACAFALFFSSDYCGRFRYDAAAYPMVKDWKKFNKLCQQSMNEVYQLLQQLQYGDEAFFQQIFGAR